MLRSMAAILAAIVVSGGLTPPTSAGAARSVAASAFETVPLPAPANSSHRAAYASLIGGFGLMGASFTLAHRADRAYDRYLAAVDPGEIERAYDESSRNDRLSSAALISGEVLVATGIYLRFVRHPRSRLALSALPGRCAIAYSF